LAKLCAARFRQWATEDRGTTCGREYCYVVKEERRVRRIRFVGIGSLAFRGLTGRYWVSQQRLCFFFQR
jgi:hypothetical protein